MSLNYNEIGKNIREVRKENGLSQAMLSELVEKSPSYISYIETGKRSGSHCRQIVDGAARRKE